MSGTVNIDLGLNSVHPSGGLLDIGILGTSINTIFFTIILFIVSILIIFRLSKFKIIELKRSLLIFSFHSIFSVIFISALMTLIVNDLDTYFQIGIIYPDDGYYKNFNIRTWGILTISQFYRIFYYFFKLDFLTVNILFGCMGSFVLIFYDKLLLQNLNFNKTKNNLIYYIFYLIVFFPSLSVWTGYLGKEIFTFIILILISLIIIKEKNLLLVTLFLLPLVGLLGLIRPHFAFMIIFTFIIYIFLKIFKKNKSSYLIITVCLFLSLIFGQFLFVSGNIEFNIIKLIDKFFTAGAQQRIYFIPTSEWGSFQNSNPFYLWISFLFSPIINLENPRNIFLSLENLILIITLIILMFNIDFKKFKENDEAKFFIIFFLISSFVMSIFTYQIGIYWRQKWILLPYLFLGLSMIQNKNYLHAKK